MGEQNDKLLAMKWVRGLLMVLLLVVVTGCSGRKDLVRWVPLEKALVMQQDSKQPILFYFYSPNCIYCTFMRLNTFSDPEVAAQVNSVFIPVKLDIEEKGDGEMPSGSKLAAAFHIRAVPALMAVNGAHRTLDVRMGFLTVRKALAFVSAVAAGQKGSSAAKGIRDE